VLIENRKLPCSSGNHKSELATLRQCQGKQQSLAQTHVEQPGLQAQHQAFHHDQGDHKYCDQPWLGNEQRKINAGAHGDKKQSQQQAFERLDIDFQFMAKFILRQYYTGEKRSQCR